MIFLGDCYLGLDATPYSCNNIENMHSVTLKNSKVDGIHIQDCVSVTEPAYFEIPSFQWNTVLSSHYEDGVTAGNIDWALENIREIYVKMREHGTFKWITIARYEINTIEDFSFSGISFLNASGKTYDIAFVPIINGEESNYIIHQVDSSFDQLMLCDKDVAYSTLLDIGNCDTTRNIDTVTLKPVYEKYPYVFNISEAEYDSGDVEACWIEESALDDFDLDGRNDFIEKIKQFISNGKPKLLKHYDGRNWLIAITGNITDTCQAHWQHRLLKFEWVEIGNPMSEKDLYENGISKVSPEYYSQLY